MSYRDHARRQQEEAVAKHKEWWATLTPAQRKTVQGLNLDAAPEDDPEVNGHNPCQVSDIADSPRARVEWDPADLDSPTSILAEQFGVDIERALLIQEWVEDEINSAVKRHEGDLLSIVVGGLISAKNVKIATAGLAFASKLAGLNGYSGQSDFARRHSVSRSAISKSTKAWQRDLNLNTSVHQKSEGACEKYSHTGKTNHWRTQKVNASALLKKLRNLLKPEPPCKNSSPNPE